MLRRIPRFLRRAVLVAVVLAVAMAVFQSWSAGAPGTGGWTQTQWGPLGPADRDLIQRVRQADLWEGPTGQQAEQMATSPAVREVGRKLGLEHAALDIQVRELANELGVQLTSSPTAQQMSWMADISSRTGADYDQTFIQRVREAHGVILPIITAVRSGTRNDKMRAFAEQADQIVTRHHQYLESTGLVNYAALPTPPSPGLLSGSNDPRDLILPIVVFVLTVLGAIALFSALRARGSTQPSRVTVQGPGTAAAPLPALATVAALPGPRGGPDAGRDSPMLESGYRESGYRAAPIPEEPPRRAEPREYRSSDTGTYRPVSGETETFRAITESDVFRPVSDSGGYRAVTDSGGYRAVTDSGSHRSGGKSRSRHSIRR